MNNIKKPLVFTLAVLPIAIVGGYFTALMSFSMIDNEALDEAAAQLGSVQLLAVISTIQPAILTAVCAFFGYVFSEKVGLMRPFGFKAKSLCVALPVSIIGGAIFSLDAWTFSRWIPNLSTVAYSDTGHFDPATWITSVLYGGVVEEVMMRLFLMSGLSLLVWKLFYKKSETVPTGVFVAANIIAALLFAAGHLPSTAMMFGELTPMLVFRCFLLNGSFGLLFGLFYRKYGIQYAMLSHITFHLVARTIWLIAF